MVTLDTYATVIEEVKDMMDAAYGRMRPIKTVHDIRHNNRHLAALNHDITVHIHTRMNGTRSQVQSILEQENFHHERT